MEPIDEVEGEFVTLCPDCDGEGELLGPDGEMVPCGNPEAEWNGIAHVLPEDDEDEGLILESGPDTFGLQLVEGGGVPEKGTPASVDEVAGVETVGGLDWPADPIGVVVEGQDDGLAHRVMRALGGGEGPFVGDAVKAVNEFRESCELEDYPESTVVGKVWALVMPPLKVGSRGAEVNYLCKALGVPVKRVMDTELLGIALAAAGSNFSGDPAEYEFDVADWLAVL